MASKAPHKPHTDSVYEGELRQVRENLLRMAGLVEEMIADSVDALMNYDAEKATGVIERDHKVNGFEVETDELCLLILAKRQPLASDLRFITLSMKMVTDLERIGDLAVNIAERVLAIEALEDPGPIHPLIERMSELTQAMVRDSIDAFIGGDAEKAQDVWDRDGQVDELYHEVSRDMQTRMHESDRETALERAMHVHAAAKFLERIGDHATNLCELVVFMIKGKDVRHIGKLG